MTEPIKQFDFGQNWREFSATALDAVKVSQARRHFEELVAPLELKGRSFLDIGFGQGLGLLTATALGARSAGCDINPKCAEVLRSNAVHFPEVKALPPLVVGSILADATVDALRLQAAAAGDLNGFQIVHSWGVLHHTGDMKRALLHATCLVAPGGYFIVAIYNRHWSSRAWLAIKYVYVSSPRLIQKAMIGLFYPVIYFAKWLVTRSHPRKQERGMDFYYDIIDWVGGYPYEFASIPELKDALRSLGFTLRKCVPAAVPTGCNQFVFQRDPTSG